MLAAGNSTYLSSAITYKARSLAEESDSARNYNVFNYQNSLPGVNLLLAQATGFATNEYTLATKGFMIVWMSGKYTIRLALATLAAFNDNAQLESDVASTHHFFVSRALLYPLVHNVYSPVVSNVYSNLMASAMAKSWHKPMHAATAHPFALAWRIYTICADWLITACLLHSEQLVHTECLQHHQRLYTVVKSRTHH